MSEDFSPFKSDIQTTNAVVANRYELLQLIGQGAMSKVYKSRDGNLGRVVAIKFLREEYGQNQSFVTRFYREARAVASLPGEHLVSIYDYGHHGATYYIVMEFVDGKNLKELLRQDGLYPASKVIQIVTPVLLALKAAHAQGIIHRDVKPQNILVRKDDGAVKLTDFGVAHTHDNVQMTSAGMVIGTVDYMAPEQARGETVGPPADLYAVGVVMFELLTGRLPYTGDNTMQIIMGHIQQPIPSVAGQSKNVSPALERVVHRALAKDVRNRFQTAQEMLNALEMVTSMRQEESVFNEDTAASAPVWPSQDQPVTDQPTSVNPVRPLAFNPEPAAYTPGEAAYQPAEDDYIEQPVRSQRAAARPAARGSGQVPPDRATPRAVVARSQPQKSRAWIWILLVLLLMLAAIGGVVTYLLLNPASSPAPENPPGTTAVASATTPPNTMAVASTTAVTPTTVSATKAVPTSVSTPVSISQKFDFSKLDGAYERDDSTLFGRTEKALYGVGSTYDRATITFNLDHAPTGQTVLKITGLDDELAAHCTFLVLVNGVQVFKGPNAFPTVPGNDAGSGGKDRYWNDMSINVPASALKTGQNTITLQNLDAWKGSLGVPYILINQVSLQG